MEMSTTKNIYGAFVQAQKEFSPALKTASNPHFKSRYADLATCVEAVLDALNNHGIALMQRTHEDASGVTVETVFIHESGEEMNGGRLHVPASKQDPQGYGSALSYARRYSLMAACGIAPEDDDGNAATKAVRDNRSDSVGLANAVQAIRKATTVDEISQHLKASVAMFPASKDALTKHASERKAQLTKQEQPA
jgi:hypothetical protein